MKIVDYCIIFTAEGEDAEAVVKNMIKQGWQPLGSPFIDVNCSGIVQAMVVYEEHEPEWRKHSED